MKVLFVIAVFCIASTLGSGLLNAEQRVWLTQYKEECIAETGVDAALVEDAKNGKVSIKDEKLQCFAACLLQRLRILDSDGQFDSYAAHAQANAVGVPQEEIQPLVASCGGHVGQTVCETGGRILLCFLKAKTFQVL